VDEMFRVKLEIPGLHRYSVEIKIGGASLKFDSALLIYGLLTTKLSSFYMKHNGIKILTIEAFASIEHN
jgi:hypothetical protein